MTTVAEYRAAVNELAVLASVDIDVLIRSVSDGIEARAILAEAFPDLAAVYGSAAGSLAADWYEELRDAADAPTGFRVLPADLPDAGRYDSLARWAVDPIFAAEPDFATATTRAAGGMQRIIANAGRDTIIGSSTADPAAQGWKRMASAGACGFCRMLADRGVVYTKASVDFGAHDHCSCVAVPQFGGDVIATDHKVTSSRRVSDADRARTRAWMRTHGY